MLDILQDLCLARGYEHARLDGGTSDVQRRMDTRRFNAPESNLLVFLMLTTVGGSTVKLPTADTVILYDSDWNPKVCSRRACVCLAWLGCVLPPAFSSIAFLSHPLVVCKSCFVICFVSEMTEVSKL